MTSIVRWSITFRLLIIALAGGLILSGATQLPKMPADATPEFTPPYVEVQTEALGLSAAEVEQFITVPLEADLLSGVAWVDTIRSESIAGLSSIVLIFEPSTDLMRARQVVTERLTQAHALPNVSKPPTMIQPLSSASRVMVIGLSSQELSAIEMSVLARWNIRPRLMGVPGVANVAIWGQRERQLQVQVDPQRLDAAGVTLDQVIRTTGNALWVSPLSYLNASTPGSGGFIDTPNQRIGIRHVLPIRTPQDLEQVPIEGSDRRLGDVTSVVEDHQPLIGDALTGGESDLLLVVEKLPGVNTLEVSRGIESTLQAMGPGLQGIAVDTSLYRPAGYVESAIDTVGLAALAALLLALVAAAVLLRGVRAAVITVVSVVLSLVAAAVVLDVLGMTANTLILAGVVLALAILVDDAVSSVHAIATQLRGASDGRERRGIVIAATAAVRTPLLYATVITVLAVVPLLALDGETGAYLRPFALAYLVATVASTIVALTITPVLALTLLRGGTAGAPRARGLFASGHAIGRIYARALAGLLTKPARALMVVAVLAIAGLATAPALVATVGPQFRERDLMIDIDATAGTSRPEINRIAAQASAALRAVPGVENVGGHVGRAIMSDTVVGMDAGQLWLNIAPDADYDATVQSVRDVLADHPGLELRLGSYIADQTAGVFAPSDGRLTVRVFGPDLAVLQEQGDRVMAALAAVPGLADARVERDVQEPQVEVEVDIAAASSYGLKPGDVRRQAATLLSGLEVGNLFEDQKVFEVVVWGVPDVRHSLTSINELRLDTPSGDQVRLADVADIRVAPTPSIIRREGISRRIDVTASVVGADENTVRADIQNALAGLAFPREYHPELLAATEGIGFGAAPALAIAAIVGILLVLQAASTSWRLAALSLIALPMALVGGLVATALAGGVVSLGTLMGFLVVLAIAVRHELSLSAHIRELELAGMQPGRDLVLQASRDRLLPTTASIVVAAVALAPLIVLGDRPGLELVGPLAVTVLGGLVTSTVLTLFVAPALHADYHGSPESMTAPSRPMAEPQTSGVS